MNKDINNSSNVRADSESALSNSIWLKENQALIEKLEAAYQKAPESNDSNMDNQYYGIEFTSLNLLIDKNTSSELLEHSSIYPIPLAAEWIIGVVNIRGDIVPIINFEKLICKESTKINISKCRIIIINKGEDAVGFIINDLPKPINFTESEKLTDGISLPKVVSNYALCALKETKAYG